MDPPQRIIERYLSILTRVFISGFRPDSSGYSVSREHRLGSLKVNSTIPAMSAARCLHNLFQGSQ